MTKASAEKLLPQVSKVSEIRDLPAFVEPETLDIGGTRPLNVLENPDDIIPHDQIPARLKVAIMDMCGERIFNETQWSRMRLAKLSRAITHPRENVVNSLAQICAPSCPFLDICQYEIAGITPVGMRCPVEIRNSQILYKEYLAALSDRLGVEKEDLEGDMITFNMVMGIVEADIITNRLNSIISTDGYVQEDPSAIDSNTGRVYYRDEEAVASRIKERINKRKDILFEQLIATPEMQAKYRNKKGNNTIARMAELMEKIERHIDKEEDGDIIDAEFERS